MTNEEPFHPLPFRHRAGLLPDRLPIEHQKLECSFEMSNKLFLMCSIHLRVDPDATQDPMQMDFIVSPRSQTLCRRTHQNGISACAPLDAGSAFASSREVKKNSPVRGCVVFERFTSYVHIAPLSV